MRIALISFEFPPAVAVGGIGTYTWQAANMLHAAGHAVEVFAAGRPGQREATAQIRVNRVPVATRAEFREALVPIFRERHTQACFEVAESPEYGAEGAGVHAAFPALARVIRLHTPHFVVRELNRLPIPWSARLRFAAGALRKGRLSWLRDDPSADAAADAQEQENARGADVIAAPCRSIREIVSTRWQLAPDSVRICPNVFEAAADLTALTSAPAGERVLFVGRLEVRKGILELAAAIPRVLAARPGAEFYFAGPAVPVPYRRHDTEQWLRKLLGSSVARCHFLGSRTNAELRNDLAQANVTVFPSRWENFPNVCLEAMSAGRAVVGSAAGGMADMIEPESSGLLVPPMDPSALAAALIRLLAHPADAMRMGERARERVRTRFSAAAVLPTQMEIYSAACTAASRRTLANLAPAQPIATRH